jgi:hypothetical protein
MGTKHIHHIHPHSPFPCANPITPRSPPTKKKIYLPLLPFIFWMKYILMSQGGFMLVLQVYTFCAFCPISPSPLLPTYSLSPCFPDPQQPTVWCIIDRWVVSIFLIL